MLTVIRNNAPVLALALGMVLAAPTMAMAQVAGGSHGPGPDNHGGDGGVACVDGTRGGSCAAAKCCVRAQKKVRVMVDGRWRVRTVMTGWKCYSGPKAQKMCQKQRH